MSSTRLDRLLRRISPDAITRSYLAKFAIVVLVVVAAIGAVGAVTYAETTERLEASAQEDYTAVAELSGIELDGWTSARRSTARDIADNEAFSNDPDVTSRYLSSHKSRTAEEVVALHHVDREEGVVLASSQDDLDAGAAVTGQEWFDDNLLYGNQVYTTPTYEGEGEQRVAYVALTPMRDYLVMEVDLAPVVADLRRPTDGAFTTIVQSDGTIAAGDREGVAGERYNGGVRSALFDDENPIGHVASATFGFAEGTEYFVADAPVPSEDWSVAVHVPLSEAYALSGMIGRNLLLIIGVAVASPASLVSGTGPYGAPTRSSKSPMPTIPNSSSPALSAIAAPSMMSVIGCHLLTEQVAELRVPFDHVELLDDRVEAVVPPGREHDRGHEQQQAHEVAVDEPVSELGVSEPEQDYEDGPVEGGEPGERPEDQRQPDQRLEEGNARFDEPREAVPHLHRDAAERRARHVPHVRRPVGVREPALDDLCDPAWKNTSR